MQNFVFYNPTKIVFGRDTVRQIGEEAAPLGKKCLFLYGRSSIKKNGVYDIVAASLNEQGIEYVECPGVKANPVLSHTLDAVEIAKREKVDFILAVGGGSVIDEAKAVAAGAVVDFSPWEFYLGNKTPEKALPIAVVLTLAATGSEMNGGTVITNEETHDKFAFGADATHPRVSILDPTATFSVPKDQTAYGSVDAIAHLLEGYLTTEDPFTPVQDRYAEGLIATLMETAGPLLENPEDYERRAAMMWSATLAWNKIAISGLGEFRLPNHMIGHAFSALYDLAHGATLSVVIPSWLRWRIDNGHAKKIAQFAQRVCGIRKETEDETALAGVEAYQAWARSIGSPTTLEEANVPEEDVDKIAETAFRLSTLWGMDKTYTLEVIRHIVANCK